MTKRRDKRIIPFCTIIFTALFAFVFLINKNNIDSADAADLSKFNPGNIISDYTMSNYNSMTEQEIQNFLTNKNSCSNRDYSYYEYLSNRNPGIAWHWKDGHFVCISEELFGDGMVIGEGKTAARIIYETAQEYRINPQVLLVLIQKESGLITDPIPNSYDYRTMTGFGCPDTAPCDSQYFGFKNQIRKAAWLFREVLDGGWTNYPLGENYVQYNPDRNCGGSIVNIENLATSSLYRYTPYQPNAAALAAGTGTAYCGAYGNRNFYSYFYDWFGDPTIMINDLSQKANIEDGIYTISSAVSNNMIIDLANNGVTNGTNVQINNAENSSSKEWIIKKNEVTGHYKIIENKSGKALDILGGEIRNSANVQLFDSIETCAQEWDIMLSKDKYVITSACDKNKVIDIAGGNMNNGTNVQLFSYLDTDTQKWIFEKTRDLRGMKIKKLEKPVDGTYIISSAVSSNMVIDLTNNGTTNGTNVQINNIENSSSKEWIIKKNETTGYYRIIENSSNRSLDILGGEIRNSANVQLFDSIETCAQEWDIIVVGEKYEIRSACDLNKTLDIAGGNMGNGTNVQLYEALNVDTQKWNLEMIKDEQGREVKKLEKPTDGIYVIHSAVSDDIVISLAEDSILNSANVQIASKSNTNSGEWKIVFNEKTGFYKILNDISGRSLDVLGGEIRNSANVQLFDSIETCAQEWDIIVVGEKYEIRSACDLNKTLDIAGGNMSNGANIQLYEALDVNTQKWDLEKIEKNQTTDNAQVILKDAKRKNKQLEKPTDGIYIIHSAVAENVIIDLANNNTSNSANVQINNIENSSSKEWIIKKNETTGYYRIMENSSNRSLDILGGEIRNSANVQLFDSIETCAQEWDIIVVGEKYEIRSACDANKSLDINGGNMSNGTNVQLYETLDIDTQKWILEKK